jgi:hypothetical protein
MLIVNADQREALEMAGLVEAISPKGRAQGPTNRKRGRAGSSHRGVDPMTMVDFEPLTLAVPLREEPAGVFRVGKSRVLLELVLLAFKAGATPEAIVQSYDTLSLADVYAVVGRYLAAPEPFEEYLRLRDEAAAEMRHKIEELQGPQGNLRAILLARAKAKEEARAQAGQR